MSVLFPETNITGNLHRLQIESHQSELGRNKASISQV